MRTCVGILLKRESFGEVLAEKLLLVLGDCDLVDGVRLGVAVEFCHR